MKMTKFKSSEIGPIPVEWEVKRLGELGDVVTGSTPPRGDGECWGGNFNWISAKDFKGKYIVEAEEAITAKGKSFCRLLPSDSVLVTCIASIGLNAIAKKPCATNQQINAVICKVCDNEYLYYQIEAAKDRMIELAGQTAVPIINKGDFENLMIPLAPRHEQERIAEALSDVDEFLAAMTTLIEKKRAIKQGAMQQLFTGKTRLAGFTGPWVEKRFDDCFELISNNTFSREFMCHDAMGIANIHYGDVLIKYGTVLDFLKEQVDSLTPSLLIKSGHLKDGDLIIADTAEDEAVGKAVEIQHLGIRQAVAGLHTIACRPTMEFAPGWLGYYINSSAFHNQLMPLISGTKVSSISKAGLRTTGLTIPTLAEKRAIVAVLSDMDAEIAAIEAKYAKYESIKQGMMQELLTGKTRLKGNKK